MNVINQPNLPYLTVSPVTRTDSSASSRSKKSFSTSLLEEIRPHPKAAPNKTANKRKTRQTAILTSTPVKDAIELEQSGSKSRIKRKLMETEKEDKKNELKKLKDEKEKVSKERPRTVKQQLLGFITKAANLHTGVAFDNYDCYVETLTGKDTLQNTVGIVHQDETECLLQDDNVYVDPSIELQSIQQLQ
ncbi:Uncharacterized protein APZ42_031146 [Daphnia magna]|uniref:Uncharacterized protein n=1 Tax=Daphnia magna TaxID=35525 RepID=A0A164N3U1_9CRUS|nr:Uncharacterized protein APZ42_031146 [Daphnia magna]